MDNGYQQRLADWIERACLIEATARKPGNVHPAAAFDDLRYDDFVVAAKVAAPILARSQLLGVGRAVRDAVAATRNAVGTNVNLGICLLIAPLAAVLEEQKLPAGIREVLRRLTVDDAKFVYEAIRLAQPGGMGEVQDQDVRDEPTQTLWDVMKLAADRDGVAAEYAKEFRLSYLTAVAWLKKFLHEYQQHATKLPAMDPGPAVTPWEYATIGVQLSLLMVQSDTLIRRKCGELIFHETACRAEYIIKQGFLRDAAGMTALTEFDAWLRADGHRRNPGTTADLVAAIWFIALREGMIEAPPRAAVLRQAERIREAATTSP